MLSSEALQTIPSGARIPRTGLARTTGFFTFLPGLADRGLGEGMETAPIAVLSSGHARMDPTTQAALSVARLRGGSLCCLTPCPRAPGPPTAPKRRTKRRIISVVAVPLQVRGTGHFLLSGA